MSNIQTIITEAFERRASITPRNVETHVKDAVRTRPSTCSTAARHASPRRRMASGW